MIDREYNTQFSEEELATEIWKDVVGFEGHYQVSSLGRVRGLDRDSRTRRRGKEYPFIIKGTILSPHFTKNGYYIVSLIKHNKRKTFTIHRLVYESFNGKVSSKLDCCHNDSNKRNNRLSNIRVDTRKGNEADKIARGTDNRGERCGTSKLLWGDVRNIRNLYKEGKTYSQISLLFNVNEGNKRYSKKQKLERRKLYPCFKKSKKT